MSSSILWSISFKLINKILQLPLIKLHISWILILSKNIKNINIINFNKIITLRLSQSKFYLKILHIPYLIKDTNVSINVDVVYSHFE